MIKHDDNNEINIVELKIERNIVVIRNFENRQTSIKYINIIKEFRFKIVVLILKNFDNENVDESIVKIKVFAFEFRFRRRKNIKLFFKIKNSFIFIDDEIFIYDF